MAEWARSNETGCGLYLDGRAVGFMDTPELAAQVVEAMNRVGALDAFQAGQRQRLLDAPESGRERSPACPNCPGPSVPHQHMAITRTEFDRVQDQLSRVDPYDSTKGQCADPWHDGVGVEEHQACPRCGDPYRWSCCGSTDPDHLPSRCGQRT